MSLVPIFSPGLTVSGAPALTFLQAAPDATNNASSYTFSSQNIGAASDTRMVVAAFGCDQTTDVVLDSATIGGVAADIIVQTTDTGRLAAIVAAIVPLGTTADFVFNLSLGVQRAAMSAYHVTNRLDTTASDTDAQSNTCVIDVPEGGCVVAVAYSDNSTAYTTTGVTEDADIAVENPSARFASGSLTGQSSQSGLNITIDNGSGGRVVAASWGSQA